MEILEKEDIELKIDALSKMENLMLLQLNYVKFNGSYKNFPQKLRWLCMHGFPLKYFPSDLRMENVVALDMSYSNLETFDMSYGNPQQPGKRQKLSGSCSKGKRLLRSLKILNLSFCKQLRSLGSFIEFPALEELILANCISLMEVCDSIEQCEELNLIDLSYCNEVGKLLRTICKLKKVKILKLDGCNNLSEFQTEKRDLKMLKANDVISVNSQTSSSAIVEVIPRALESCLIHLPRSLVCLSLEYCHLCNELFLMDMSSLFMLKELYLDGNDIVSLPNCVRSLPRLEILSMDNCLELETLEHPPRTLKHLIFHDCDMLEKVVFDQDVSPIRLIVGVPRVKSFVEGIVKGEYMTDVEEELLHSLGWTNLDFTLAVETGFIVKMWYEFGIFSTLYKGKEMPNWISDRREGSSISFTIPSSPNNLTGLNFCFIQNSYSFGVDIKISNITKSQTWIYENYDYLDDPTAEGINIYLSHWMFGKNEMEDGDQITISILTRYGHVNIRECGVSFMYDDDGKKKKMEDVLGYYKSWNHIIGGDLSLFQTTTPGVYHLDVNQFFGDGFVVDDYVGMWYIY